MIENHKTSSPRMLRWSALALALSVISFHPLHSQAVAVPQATPAMLGYASGRDWLWVASQVIALAVPLLFLLTGWGARLRTACGSLVGHGRWRTVLLFAALYLSITVLIRLPLSYAEELLRRTYGRSDSTTGDWITGEVTASFAFVLVGTALAWLLYWLLHRSPRHWWAWGVLATAPVAALFFTLEPLAISSEPLPEGALKAQVAQLGQRAGVDNANVVIQPVDGDCASGHLKGMGPTKRIVLESGFLDNGSTRQVLAVTGHELGHYAGDDDVKGLVALLTIVLVGLGLTHVLARAAIARWGERFGFQNLTDPASLPLILFCISLIWLAILPAFNAYARHIETSADRYTAELGFAREQAQLMVRDAECYLIAPESNWFRTTFRSSHPSIGDRIRMLNEYLPASDATAESLEPKR